MRLHVSRTDRNFRAVTSTTPPVRTSSHEKYCPESQKNYCVNGGTCFTIQVTPGTNKLLCRCLPGFSGNRCQDIVPMKVMNQKRAQMNLLVIAAKTT